MITPSEATARASAHASISEAAALTTDLVERLDGGEPYFLVSLGKPDGTGVVATVNALTGEVMSSASLQGVDRHRLPDRDQAIRSAAFPGDAQARRVWLPSRATRSPFYPLWELTAGARRAYVDTNGKVWDAPGVEHRG
ncbi:MAG: PepSY domain-containing protein [Proteobacteria bacterium]|nr:PepSY domain-containing protein [Pseudomonadota bacterium]